MKNRTKNKILGFTMTRNIKGGMSTPMVIGIVVVMILVIGVAVVLFQHGATSTTTPVHSGGAQSGQKSTISSQSTITPAGTSELCTECLTKQQFSSLIGNSTGTYNASPQNIGLEYGTSVNASLKAAGETSNPAFNQSENTKSLWIAGYTVYNQSKDPVMVAGESVSIVNNAPYFYKESLKSLHLNDSSLYSTEAVNQSYEGMVYTYVGLNSSLTVNGTTYDTSTSTFIGYSGNYLVGSSSTNSYMPANSLIAYIAQDLKLS